MNIEFSGAEIEGFDDLVQEIKRLDAEVSFESVVANNIIGSSDCKSCHIDNTKLIGPSYKEISARYSSKDRSYLIDKILKGGLGAWESKMAMPAHPDINEVQAGLIVDYILGLKDGELARFKKPSGYFVADVSPNNRVIKNGFLGASNDRKFIFRASYLDKGSPSAPELLGTDVLVLRNPIVPVIDFDLFSELEFNHQITIHRSSVIPMSSGSFAALTNVDLIEIKMLKLDLSILPEAKGPDFGIIEIRLGSKDGDLIGNLKLDGFAKESGNSKPLIEIAKMDGRHDLFVVFKNTSEKSDITGIELRSVEFIK